jgi:hypothetical protein
MGASYRKIRTRFNCADLPRTGPARAALRYK